MDEKEIREAIYAGEAALISLKNAREKLNSAKNWGFFDIFGGGMLSTFIKHSKMDESSEYLEDARRKLEIFKRELRDVNVPTDISVSVDGFLKFADFFMDNVIFDLMVQSEIDRAGRAIEDTIVEVETILGRLKSFV